MTIITTDTETYEKKKDGYYYPTLNAQKYTLGIILHQNRDYETYYTPEEHYNRILQLAKEHETKKKPLYIYAHNHQYDLIAYAGTKAILNNEIKIICEKPLLAKIGTKTYLLDTLAFYRMTLAEIGELLQEPKGHMPEKIKQPQELEKYCLQDCEVVMKAIENLRKQLNTLGFKPRKLLTAGQLAITTYITHIKRTKEDYGIFWKGQIQRSPNWKETKVAFRGGHIQAYKKGTIKNCTQLDYKGFYANIMRTMPYPKLTTYRMLRQPPKEYYEEILHCIGIVQAEIRIEVPEGDKPFLPIKQATTQIRPRKATALGTWTTHELLYAREIGQLKEISIKWAEIYETDTHNRFKTYIDKLEQIEVNKPEQKQVIKLLRNNLFGKFAQTRQTKQTKFINRADYEGYKNEGWKVKDVIDNLYCIEKQEEEYIANYVNPLISTLITANARIQIHKILKYALYVNTDGILIETRNLRYYRRLIGGKYGQLKIEEQGTAEIIGEGNYKIGRKTVMNGIPQINRSNPHRRTTMITINQAIARHQLNKLGTFETTPITQDKPEKEQKPKDYLDETKYYY